MPGKIHALFDDYENARHAVEELVGMGVEKEEIAIVMAESEHSSQLASEARGDFQEAEIRKDDKSEEGAAAGAAVGGGAGAVLGWLTALGTIAIPGAGLVATGAGVAALAGAGAGGAGGGFLGMLIGKGFSDDHIKQVGTEVEKGKVLVIVDSDRDDKVIRECLKKNQGHVS